MAKKICFAQSVKELKFILSKVEEPLVCVPLDLETQLYCYKNNLEFYNPINFIDSNFHKKSIEESEKLTNYLDLSHFTTESKKKIYIHNVMFEFNTIVFLIELIEKINTKEKIDQIFLSGWNGRSEEFTDQEYFLSYLISNLVTEIKVIKLTELKEKSTFISEKKYVISSTSLNKNREYILQNTLGYNFWRTIFYLKKKKYYTLIPRFDDYSGQSLLDFFKKKILKFFNVIFIEFSSTIKQEKIKNQGYNINYSYKGKNLSKLLNLRFVYDINEFDNKCEAIDLIFSKFKIKLVLSNMAINVDEYFIEKSKKEEIPSASIPHGSIAEHFNKYDKIFKKQISEIQFAKKSKFFIVQSKISKEFVSINKIENNCIETGNLLFCDTKNSNRKKILFAVTLKSLTNFRYLGVEMYYEFLDNLNFFNKIAKKENLNFLIKPHSSENHCIQDLEKQFKNLEFTKKKINKVLKNVLVTISFSSTVIEDSLYSKVPVILLDRWKRYKHCKAEENVNQKNSAVYYVKNEDDLVKCINTIVKSNDISFKDYIFEGNTKNNMKVLLNKLL